MKKRGKDKQKSLRQDQGGEKSSEAIHVPFDLTVEILSRIPVKTLVRFRCVSKLWSSTIFTESIRTRSLTHPRQLVIYIQPFLKPSSMSSFTYPLSTNARFVAADRGTCTLLPVRNYLVYGYVRGLICYLSSSDYLAIYNPTTRQNVLLPTILQSKKFKASDGFIWYDSVEKRFMVDSKYYHVFFGYDPVKNQYKVLRFIEGARICDYSCRVITFRGGLSKHDWRNIKIQDDISPPRSNGVCINGVIYYIGGTLTASVLVLGRFDVRFERFDHIEMPLAVQMNQLEKLSLVNYQGKLGCTFYSKDRAEVWIMKDHLSDRQEWSKVTLGMSLPDMLKTVRIAGVTLNGEIVIMPKTFDFDQTLLLYAYFYDPKENKTRKVEFETTTALKGERGVRIFSEPDHMENTTSLFGSQFNKKKKWKKKKKKSATTAGFS